MKFIRLLLSMLLLVSGAGRAAQALEPAPFLEIYAAKVKGDQMTQMGFDPKHPLMIINSIKEVRLAKDNKGVLLVLTDEDTKAFAEMTKDYDGRPLIFKSGEVVRLVNINGAVDDGHVGFKYPEAEATAEQLRRYFHLAEFKGNSR